MLILKTDRLTLREFSLNDAAFILQLLNEPSFYKNIGDRGIRTLQQAEDYLKNGPLKMYADHGFGLWRVEITATSDIIGMCGLIRRPTFADVDVGFALMPQFWRKSFAFEAAMACLQYGFSKLNLPRLTGIVSAHNTYSIRILEKLGMKFEKTTQLTAADEVLIYTVEKPN